MDFVNADIFTYNNKKKKQTKQNQRRHQRVGLVWSPALLFGPAAVMKGTVSDCSAVRSDALHPLGEDRAPRVRAAAHDRLSHRVSPSSHTHTHTRGREPEYR